MASEYLTDVCSVSPETIEKYVNPTDGRVSALNEIYMRLLISAQNAGMGPYVIGASIGGVQSLGRVLFNFDPKLVAEKYTDGWQAVFDDIKRELKPTGQLLTNPGSK